MPMDKPESDIEIAMAFIDAVEASLGDFVPKDLYALARRGAEMQWRPTHRHVKRGTLYQVIGEGTLQSRTWTIDYTPVTVYRDHDGKLWVRQTEEFNDGRFLALPPPLAGETE